MSIDDRVASRQLRLPDALARDLDGIRPARRIEDGNPDLPPESHAAAMTAAGRARSAGTRSG